MKSRYCLLAVVASILAVGLTAAPVPKDGQKEIAKVLAELQGEWTCCNRKSASGDTDHDFPDGKGTSCHLVFSDQHLSILDRNRESRITGHECCDFELSKYGTRTLMVRKNISSHCGGINHYPLTYLVDVQRSQLKLTFYVKNDIRGGFADLTEGEVTDDYDEVVWTYNPVKKK